MIAQKSYETSSNRGALYLVGTPIGNLEDMTYRAVRILQEADLIAAEDTRQTRKLLSHFQISTRLVSYHEHNKYRSGPELIRLVKEEGKVLALVSDAGLPAISDPGWELVQSAVEADVPVIPIPGANAALTALIASGLPTEQFTFLGFLPRDKKSLTAQLEQWKSVRSTLILYESPHRIIKTLTYMSEVLGERRVCLARELTKRHEEFIRGSIKECLQHMETDPPLGEYCIVVESAESSGIAGELDPNESWWHPLTLEEHTAYYIDQSGDKKAAIKQVAADRGLPKREVYNALEKQRHHNPDG